MPKYNGPRPTMADAHRSLQTPLRFDQKPYLTWQEREIQIETAKDEHLNRCKRLLKGIRNLQLLILAGHVAIEHSLDTFIQLVSVASPRKKLNLKFSDKVDFAYALGLGHQDTHLIPSIDRLNSIRNGIAHKLTVNFRDLDELIRINSDDYHEKDTYTDRERLKRLRSILWYICGSIAGMASAMAYLRDVIPYYEEELKRKTNTPTAGS